MRELTLSIEAVETLVENLAIFEELDPTNDDEFKEGTNRLLAIRYMFTDILREAGEDDSVPTDLEELVKSRNPYYVAIFTNEGRIP